MAKTWVPVPTEDDIRKSEESKSNFIGPEGRQPPDTFKIPGAKKRSQKSWASFTYVPPPPIINMSSWRFETYGLVNEPLSLTYSEFKKLPATTSSEHHTCFDQVYTPDHDFEGVDFKTIIELTKPDPDCKWILYECNGGYTVSHSILRSMMLVYKRNGEPLDPCHGYPLRAWIPAEWGFKNPKWVWRIKFCEEREPDFWMAWCRKRGIDMEILTAGYDTNVSSGVDIDTLEKFNKFIYLEWEKEVRDNLLGARGKGQSLHRAPVYIGDDTWKDHNFKYTMG